MRLRRETGDFQIKVTSDGVNTIRKGLGANDLIGETVAVEGGYVAVTSAIASDNGIVLTTTAGTYTYNPATGEITAA